MARCDASTSDCLVLTYKEGLLSTVAHDLELRVKRFQVDVDDTTHAVRATFDPASLEVVGARRNGAVVAGLLSPKDLRQVADNIASDVLEPRRHPEVRFESSRVVEEGAGFRVTGTLFLHGRRKELTVPVRREGARWVAEVALHQPDFGIKPFSAMLGALKVKPGVTVRLSVPVAPHGLSVPVAS